MISFIILRQTTHDPSKPAAYFTHLLVSADDGVSCYSVLHHSVSINQSVNFIVN